MRGKCADFLEFFVLGRELYMTGKIRNTDVK
jgi:hypothetical protein